MDRLTENFLGCYQIKGCDNFTCEETCNNVLNCGCCPISEAINKLAEYENLEEQGLLLRLPCKVGDTVWDNDYRKSYAYTITGFSFGTGKGYIDKPISKKEVIYYYSNYSGSITGGFVVSENGKTVFLTKSEVEQKLKEMESE